MIYSKYFIVYRLINLISMTLEMIINELTEIAHRGVLYVLIGSFGFLSIIIISGIIKSTRRGKRNMNKS